MNAENTKKLLTDFPTLYQQYSLPMTETSMCWGFECGDGWFDLIYDLSDKLSKLDPKCQALQVKEKYGTLRFLGVIGEDAPHDAIYDLISEYEDKSGETCEVCGKKGKLRGVSWYRTLCDNCDKKG